MEGQTEFSIINLSELDAIKLRLDAEFYQTKYLELIKKLSSLGSIRLSEINAVLDCSAFYPAITDSYSFEGKGIPFLRVNEIQNGLVRTTDGTAFLPQTILDENNLTICRASPFDIVIAKGGNSLAKLGLLPSDYKSYALSRDLIVMRTSNLTRNKYFVWLFLHCQFGQELLWRTASQTGQPHLTLPSILEIAIPEYSKEFEGLAEKLYRRSEALKNRSASTYRNAEELLLEAIRMNAFSPSTECVNIKSFVNSFAVTGRLDAEHYQAQYDDIEAKIKAYKGGYTTIGELVHGLMNGAEVREYQDEGVPYLRVGDLKQLDIDADSVVRIDPEAAEKGLEKIPLQAGDVLVSRSGSLAVTAVVEPAWTNALISSHLIRLRIADHRIDPYFLALYLSCLPGKKQILKWSNGGVQPEISQPALKAILVPIVDANTQKEIRTHILDSRRLRQRSAQLLDVAKRAVEIAIEQDEAAGLAYIQEQTTIQDVLAAEVHESCYSCQRIEED